MHFSVPDTSELSNSSSTTSGSNSSSVTLFNIHINGVHHCSLRYSQLHTFNDELQRLLPTVTAQLQPFPRKKLFSLSARETDERRIHLERYLQSIAQNKYIVTSSFFNEFFLNAQRETFAHELLDHNNSTDKVQLEIYLLNGHAIKIDSIYPTDNTLSVLDACAVKIQLPTDFISYFALFLVEQSDTEMNFVRHLFEFEAPYLSLKLALTKNEQTRIVLKKSYWDSNFDLQLLDERRARNLLFVQAQYEFEHNTCLTKSISAEAQQQLVSFRDNKSFKEYLLLAKTLKFYGYILIKSCSILYPLLESSTSQKLLQCTLAIGNSELICCFDLDNNENKKSGVSKELSFKVTRIRCWKVSWTRQQMNIAFEYLVKKDTLQWITLHSEQAALVSTCLQSMVDEILAKKSGATGPSSPSAVPIPEPPSAISNKSRSNAANGLTTRTKSDVDRLNNNDLFEKGLEGDDDL